MFLAQRAVGFLPAPRWAIAPLRDVYIASGFIGAASSALSIGQALGWHPTHQWLPDQAPGLFYNPAHAGYTLALIFMALLANRLYWLIPMLLPGLYLSHARGAWAAIAFGLLATWLRKPLWLLAIVLAFAFILTLHPSSSDLQRLQIWRAAWINLTFWGNGLGSFWDLYMGDPVVHPEYAHNDYLQTVFEFGIGAIVPFAIVAWAASRTLASAWPTLVTFLFIACFSMPMHMPVAALIGTLALLETLWSSRC